jgi:recombination protein RecA
MRSPAARAELESLLKARKLDITLTSAAPLWRNQHDVASTGVVAIDAVAPTGVTAIDDALGGGLRRGQLSEIVGARSSGRTSVMCRTLAHATARGELTALIDPCDRFDPTSAEAMGVELSQLLWVRDTGDPQVRQRLAVKAINLVLQAGGFGLVVLDVADLPLPAVRGLPFTTWFRLSRVIEGSATVVLLVAAEHVARSSGGATICMDGTSGSPAIWRGNHSNRARLLTGVTLRPQVKRSALG